MVRYLLIALFAALTAVMPVSASGIVVLGEEPQAEFTLPDGSVLKNAFVWRRSSEGLMIVHDDGQYFLNFKLLPADWRAAYLGEPQPEEAEQAAPELADPHHLKPILEKVPDLRPESIVFLLRADADEDAQKSALALSVLQSLLDDEGPDSKRLMLLIEESGFEIEGVSRDELSQTCKACGGTGRVTITCKTCGGTGECPKCGGDGKRSRSLGAVNERGTYDCITCKGTGECPDCKGEGGHESACRRCRGRGQVLRREYCEAQLGFFVQKVNRSARPDLAGSVVQADRDRIMQTLFAVPGLENGAVHFYGSKVYDGSMDTNIVVACLMQALLNRDMENARRFNLTLTVNYGEGTVLDIENYLTSCPTCDGSGMVEIPCSACGGTGECQKCGGDGEKDMEFMSKTVPCTACAETGKCPKCRGTGVQKIRCADCRGTGSRIDTERAEVQRKLMTAKLNQFYRESRKQ